jgi:hypothetical protein
VNLELSNLIKESLVPKREAIERGSVKLGSSEVKQPNENCHSSNNTDFFKDKKHSDNRNYEENLSQENSNSQQFNG